MSLTDITLLRMSPIEIPPYSARGIRQTLTPIGSAGQLRRTVNGTLVDLSATQMRKYASTITCTDMDSPALDGVWPGLQVTVDCIVELAYKTAGGSASRSVVSGSTRTDGGLTFYRPKLTMLVVSYRIDYDEWGAATGWTLDLEEV